MAPTTDTPTAGLLADRGYAIGPQLGTGTSPALADAWDLDHAFSPWTTWTRPVSR